PGRCEASNPESRDSGSGVGDHPGMTGANQYQQRQHLMSNEMVLQKLDSGLLTITMNRPDRRNALNPDMTRGLVEAARRAMEDHEGPRRAGEGRRRHLLRRRRREIDGGGPRASRLRSQDDEPAQGHGGLAHPAPDAKTRG